MQGPPLSEQQQQVEGGDATVEGREDVAVEGEDHRWWTKVAGEQGVAEIQDGEDIEDSDDMDDNEDVEDIEYREDSSDVIEDSSNVVEDGGDSSDSEEAPSDTLVHRALRPRGQRR